jgi:enoyl-CoA hydratase
MSYAHIRLTDAAGVTTLTIDRPAVRNALDRATVGEIRSALADLAARTEPGVLIVTGAGDQAFVAGADINELNTRTVAEGLTAVNSSLFAAVEQFAWPTIAAVNGYALGGGCELALACDIRIAADTAKFGQPELNLGIIPGAGATQRLPRIVGLGRAKHLILTGDIIDAHQALAIGLVSAVVPAPELISTATDLARRILRKGPLAARLAKLALNMSVRTDLDAGLMVETLAQSICYGSQDKIEGTAAFLEKRPAKFTGR